jgi:DNA-binding GntR family transcriptional regulator
MDDPMQASFGADFEIEQRLERYAQVRLSPAPASVARMRARVMRETRLAISSGALRPAPAPVDLDRRRAVARRTALRRVAGLGLAAALSVGAVGGVMAAGTAGGPLYDARVWLESLALPSGIDARADAEIARLEARMTEILAAAGSGDSMAVEDALAAYQAIADEALSGAAGDADALERIRLALDRHLAVLTRVADKVPAQASAAIRANIERAIVHNNEVIDRVQSGNGGGNGGAPVAPTDQNPEKTPKPDKTPKPAATVAPTPAPTPDPTPGRTPPGPPSPKPDKTPPAGGGSNKP